MYVDICRYKVLGSLAHPDFESLAHPTKWSHLRTLILSHSRTLTTKNEYPSTKNPLGFSIRGHGGDMGLGGMGQHDLGLTGQETDFESLAHPDQK